MNFHKNLKNARKDAGMTQQELADTIGVRQKDISRWENGDRTPGIVALADLCRALHVSADVLLETGKGEIYMKKDSQ